MPEVTIDDSFGKAIFETISNYRIFSVLEIGAFNGDGSTQVIAKALKSKGKNISLTCLEYNHEWYRELINNTVAFPFVTAVNQSSIGKGSFTNWNFESDVWNSPYNGLKSQYSEEQVKGWHQNDVCLMEKNVTGYLEETTESWDAALIDGGEFCGWDEFRLVKQRTHCIMLDDAYKAFKTFRSRIELSRDPDWIMIWNDPYIRNGAAIFVRKKLERTGLIEKMYNKINQATK
jgi:hypothetical protein